MSALDHHDLYELPDGPDDDGPRSDPAPIGEDPGEPLNWPPGRSALWHSLGGAEAAPAAPLDPGTSATFVCRRPASGGNLEAALNVAGKIPTRKELGAQEVLCLDALLEAGDLRPDQRDAFQDMRAAIDPQFGRYPSLTPKQRSWVLGECEKRGIDPRPPEVKNANVPREKPVAPMWNQQQLPLAPPGRKPPEPPKPRGAFQRRPSGAAEVVDDALSGESDLVRAGAAADLEEFIAKEEQVVQRTPGEAEVDELAAAGARGFRVDMGTFRGAALRASRGAPFEMPPGSVEPLEKLAAAAPPGTVTTGKLLPARVPLVAEPGEPRLWGQYSTQPVAPPAPPPVVLLSAEGAKLFRDGVGKTASAEAKGFRSATIGAAKKTSTRDRVDVRIVDQDERVLATVDSRGWVHESRGT